MNYGMGMPMGVGGGQNMMQPNSFGGSGEQRFMHMRSIPKIKVLHIDKYTIKFKSYSLRNINFFVLGPAFIFFSLFYLKINTNKISGDVELYS